MELIWIEPHQVDKVRWDALCQRYQATPFVRSAYLDAVSEQWGLLWSEEHKAGMPVPFTVRLSVQCVVTPTFLRYVEWVGGHVEPEDMLNALQQRFKFGSLNIRQLIPSGITKHFQELRPTEHKLNQQAKRSLKKAANLQVIEQWDPERLIHLITDELAHRIPGIDAYSLPKLRQLVAQRSALNIRQLNVEVHGEWHGGLWVLVSQDRLIYLKGTCTPEIRSQGGMYAMIAELIRMAEKDGKLLDFGGSNVENVRRFNLAFGASDVPYSQITWNHAPLWWNLLRKWKQRLRN